ncbi:hypothetical protein [Deinococcus yunweiensis]|uniref:DUF7669 domain-containing protein n=1 Tax=Deinococcus yunweiensis TaxID=367282 RepID=UPI00398F20C9
MSDPEDRPQDTAGRRIARWQPYQGRPPSRGAMSCREEILAGLHELLQHRPHREFLLAELLSHMARRGTCYGRCTVRRHVLAVMCTNSTSQGGGMYPDLMRVRRGVYRAL